MNGCYFTTKICLHVPKKLVHVDYSNTKWPPSVPILDIHVLNLTKFSKLLARRISQYCTVSYDYHMIPVGQRIQLRH